jgi:hypothetical protein
LHCAAAFFDGETDLDMGLFRSQTDDHKLNHIDSQPAKVDSNRFTTGRKSSHIYSTQLTAKSTQHVFTVPQAQFPTILLPEGGFSAVFLAPVSFHGGSKVLYVTQ